MLVVRRHDDGSIGLDFFDCLPVVGKGGRVGQVLKTLASGLDRGGGRVDECDDLGLRDTFELHDVVPAHTSDAEGDKAYLVQW